MVPVAIPRLAGVSYYKNVSGPKAGTIGEAMTVAIPRLAGVSYYCKQFKNLIPRIKWVSQSRV